MFFWFSSLCLLSVTCVKFSKAICAKDFMILQLIWMVMYRSLRQLMVCVWMVRLIPTIMVIGGSTTHPCWARSCCKMAYLSSLLEMASMGKQSL